jgi:hypothetical protein
MSKPIELKVLCQVMDNWPLPDGAGLCWLTEKRDIPVYIDHKSLQFYYKDGMFMIDREVAKKLLELLNDR